MKTATCRGSCRSEHTLDVFAKTERKHPNLPPQLCPACASAVLRLRRQRTLRRPALPEYDKATMRHAGAGPASRGARHLIDAYLAALASSVAPAPVLEHRWGRAASSIYKPTYTRAYTRPSQSGVEPFALRLDNTRYRLLKEWGRALRPRARAAGYVPTRRGGVDIALPLHALCHLYRTDAAFATLVRSYTPFNQQLVYDLEDHDGV